MNLPLSLASLARIPASVRRPEYDFRNLSIGIVHLGIGAFHRAHQALYTQDALRCGGGDWGILGASLRNATTAAALVAQQQLYTVETLGALASYEVVAAIRASLTADAQRGQLRSALSSSRTHIVTLTVTEKGYCLGLNGELNCLHPDIAHDFENRGEPTSAIGWLAAGLEERYQSHGRPVTIISCDNLQDNGKKLCRAVTDFVARSRPEMLRWLEESVCFPQTVVDCIVPASTDLSRARVMQALGVEDLACVQREPYGQWVIESRFAGPRPAWERAGAQIVGDVTDFRRLKLHVLNACHSALAYLGLPRGYSFVREAMADAELAQFLEALVADEIAPALAPLAVGDYWRSVRARFSNPGIDHRLTQIAEDGAAKLLERVFPLLISNAQAGAPVSRLARIVHAWLKLTRADFDTALDDSTLFPPPIRDSSTLRTAIAAAVA